MVFAEEHNDEETTLDTTPHSSEAEQALLGALLYDNEIYHRVSGIVQKNKRKRKEERKKGKKEKKRRNIT